MAYIEIEHLPLEHISVEWLNRNQSLDLVNVNLLRPCVLKISN